MTSIEHLFSTSYDSATDDLPVAALLAYVNAAMPPAKHEEYGTAEVTRAVTALAEKGASYLREICWGLRPDRLCDVIWPDVVALCGAASRRLPASCPVPIILASNQPFSLLSFIGSAAAVERIFSGGRDTISIRRASLKPDTIRTLMIVKQHLKLARKELLANA
ncbi:hypothetical protein HGRIS_001359 [Hohenbuehelia grisea]|uniref:HAT C-terminal dimerisation domain-containing protein n=1 Tax=Hohenbuehelia grisea TaxID=104357 RepID=A0ABR3JP39_9AGAR